MAFEETSGRILIRPLLTEKSDRLAKAGNQHVFQVAPGAAKGDIRRAVETLFKVKVLDVRTMAVHGKLRRQGRFQGYRPDWKKAIVTIPPGESLKLEKLGAH